MVSARRAASADDSTTVDLGAVAPARHGSPERPTGRRLTRRALAPLAIVAVVGGAIGVLNPGQETVESTDPSVATAAVPLGVSRGQQRPALEASPEPSTTSPSPTETPSASPSAEAAAETAPAEAPAEPTATPTPEPEPDYTTLGAEAGTLYAATPLNIRSGPGTSYDAISSLAQGDAATITDREADGWRQVLVGKKSGWVKASLLTDTKPAAATAKATTESEGSSGDSDEASPVGSCPNTASLEKNLTARTVAVLRALCGKFPAVTNYGGYRPGDSGYHGRGQAIDVMVSGEAGWEIARWARSNASSLGVIEVIYEQKIWTTQRSGEGWRSMSDRGSATANHYDHVHLSVR